MKIVAKQLALLTALLLIISINVQASENYESPIGEWTVQWERFNGKWRKKISMKFIDETKATYSFKEGRILFSSVDEQGRWIGHWVENSMKSCLEEKDGSKNWGVVIFEFNETFTKFKGTWDLCGEGRKLLYKGVRK